MTKVNNFLKENDCAMLFSFAINVQTIIDDPKQFNCGGVKKTKEASSVLCFRYHDE